MISPRLLWEGLVTGDPWMGGAWRGCHACGQPFREDGWPSSPRCPSCEPVRLPIMPVAACHRWTVSRPTFSSQLPVEYEAIPLDGGCIICGRQAPINRRGQCHWCWSEHSGWAPPEDLLAGPQIGPKRNEETNAARRSPANDRDRRCGHRRTMEAEASPGRRHLSPAHPSNRTTAGTSVATVPL